MAEVYREKKGQWSKILFIQRSRLYETDSLIVGPNMFTLKDRMKL